MILVVSGEGPTDIGSCSNAAGICSVPDFNIGPMTYLIDDIVEPIIGYSPIEVTPEAYHYVSEAELGVLMQERRKNRRFIVLPGSGKDHETGYFYINSWALAAKANEIELQEGDSQSIAVLFRDCDGTRSSGSNLWDSKYASMKGGFMRAEYNRGVPMLPKPKSEAWLLCAAKTNPYVACAQLEHLPGNDSSPNSAKGKLAAALGFHPGRQELVDWLDDNTVDLSANGLCTMPSFEAFRQDLEASTRAAMAR